MARPLPVNMLLAATGGVLLVSGIGGKSIGDVLKGQFGKLEVKNPNIGSEGEHGQRTATAGEGGPVAPSPVTSFTTGIGQQTVPSGSTFAPSPMNLGRHFSTWASLEREIKEHKLTKAQVTQRIKELQEGK